MECYEDINIEEYYHYYSAQIKFIKDRKRKRKVCCLKPKMKVEQNLKVKCLWLTHYTALNMTRLINPKLITFAEKLSMRVSIYVSKI